MRTVLAAGMVVAGIGLGLYAAMTNSSEQGAEPSDDPERTVAAAIELLTRSPDTDRALDLIYSAIASEAATRSGRVNSLHLQSAALRVRRDEIDTALSYLNLALGFDDHAPMHDPQAFAVPTSGAPFIPTWPLTMAAGVISLGLGVAVLGHVRSRRSTAR